MQRDLTMIFLVRFVTDVQFGFEEFDSCEDILGRQYIRNGTIRVFIVALVLLRVDSLKKWLERSHDLFEMGQQYGFTLPEVYSFNSVDDIIAETGIINSNREGWIAEFSDGQRFKFKIDEYVEIHRYLRMLDFPSILQKIRFNEIDRLLDVVPDAFLEDTKHWVGEIRDVVNDLRVQVDAVYSVADTLDRLTLEAWAQEYHPSLEVYLLAKFDGDNLDKVILDNAFTGRLEVEADA